MIEKPFRRGHWENYVQKQLRPHIPLSTGGINPMNALSECMAARAVAYLGIGRQTDMRPQSGPFVHEFSRAPKWHNHLLTYFLVKQCNQTPISNVERGALNIGLGIAWLLMEDICSVICNWYLIYATRGDQNHEGRWIGRYEQWENHG